MAERVERDEACRLLGTTPRVFRQVWSEHADLLGGVRPPRQVDAHQLRLLARALDLRAAGLGQAEVAAALTREQGDAPTADLALEVRERLEAIAAALSHHEARRLAEHDRLLTALMRTQQELSHLRYEVAAATPRRERRRLPWRWWGVGHKA